MLLVTTVCPAVRVSSVTCSTPVPSTGDAGCNGLPSAPVFRRVGSPRTVRFAFALIVVSVGSNTPDDWIARRSVVLHANTCQQCRMTLVFVMVTLAPLAIRPFDTDQIGQHCAARTGGTFLQRSAIFICALARDAVISV